MLEGQATKVKFIWPTILKQPLTLREINLLHLTLQEDVAHFNEYVLLKAHLL